MRFIGPRPEVPEYFDKNTFNFLKTIKPGISDYSSILLRHEEKILDAIGGDSPYKQLLPIKLRLAKYYSLRKSFLLDIYLVIMTLLSLVFPKYAIKKILSKNLLNDVSGLNDFIITNQIKS